ncbi:MAG: hypothetical protein ACLTZT_18765 [Butyricimonas faecalis]
MPGKEEQTGILSSVYMKEVLSSVISLTQRSELYLLANGLCNPEKIVPEIHVSLNHDEYTFKGYSSVNYSTNEDITPNELTEGEVYISQEGDTYTITFKCETSFGGPVEGSYTGLLKSIDIRKEYETTNFYKNIKLEALYDDVNYTDGDGIPHREPDYLRATSFLVSSSQQVYG